MAQKYANISITDPWALKYWDWEKNSLAPENVSKGSQRVVWWVGPCGCSWDCKVINFIKRNGKNCPFCSIKIRRIRPGFNDLATTFPDLEKEWDYKKNYPLTPKNVSHGMLKNVWWICNVCRHSWERTINGRTNGNGCPSCALRVSKMELEVGDFFFKTYPLDEIKHGLWMKSGSISFEIDYSFLERNVAFEINGTYWHSDENILRTRGISAKNYHQFKRNALLSKNIELFFVWEHDWKVHRELFMDYMKDAISGNSPLQLLRFEWNYCSIC